MAPAVRERPKPHPANFCGDGRPAIWQDPMVEVRETFRRVERVKPSGFTQWSAREERVVCRGGPTLSRNRRARVQSQADLASFHLPPRTVKELQRNRSQHPSVTFNHLQNLLGMCRRINAQSSITERRKNKHDPSLYPVFIRRPMMMLEAGGAGRLDSSRMPSSARCSPTAITRYTKRQASATTSPRVQLNPPYSYTPRRVSLLLDISNRPSCLGPPPAFVPRPSSASASALYISPRPDSSAQPGPPQKKKVNPRLPPYPPPLLLIGKVPLTSSAPTTNTTSDRTSFFDRSSQPSAGRRSRNAASPSQSPSPSPSSLSFPSMEPRPRPRSPQPHHRRPDSRGEHNNPRPRPPSRWQHERPKRPQPSSSSSSSSAVATESAASTKRGGDGTSLTTPRSSSLALTISNHDDDSGAAISAASTQSPPQDSHISALLRPNSSDVMMKEGSRNNTSDSGACSSSSSSDHGSDGKRSRSSSGVVSVHQSLSSFGALLMRSCCSSPCGGDHTISPSPSPSPSSSECATTSLVNSEANVSIPPLSGISPRTELGGKETAPMPPHCDSVATVEAGESRHDSGLTDSTRTDAPEVTVKLARTVAFHDAPSSPSASASSVRDRESELESESESTATVGIESEANGRETVGTESEADGREIGSESGRDGEEEQGSESGRDDEDRAGSESGREDQEEGPARCMPDLMKPGSGSGSESSQRAGSCGSGGGSGSGNGNGNGNGESEAEDEDEDEDEDDDADDGGVVVVQYSADAYTDFKASMMQLIRKEKLEQGREGEQLEKLLQHYRVLNPPIHHGLLHEVMMDISAELGIIITHTHTNSTHRSATT